MERGCLYSTIERCRVEVAEQSALTDCVCYLLTAFQCMRASFLFLWDIQGPRVGC